MTAHEPPLSGIGGSVRPASRQPTDAANTTWQLLRAEESTSYRVGTLRRHMDPEEGAVGAIVYLIVYDFYNVMKIGIARADSGRLNHHLREGFRLIETWSVADIGAARSVERAVIRWWRNDLGVAPWVIPALRTGYTETASTSEVSIDDTRLKIAELVYGSTDKGDSA